MIHVPVQKVNASPGRKVQLECNIESYPRADVSWEFSSERGSPALAIESDNKYEKTLTEMDNHFPGAFFTLVPFNPKPIKPLRIKVKSQMRTKMQWYHCKLVKWVERIKVNL